MEQKRSSSNIDTWIIIFKRITFIYKNNSEIRSIIDNYAVKFCDMAIHDILKSFPYYSINLIQEDIGTAYVKYL